MKREVLVKLTGAFMIVSASLAQAELRPLAADRPDATESPQTVDKGYFQVETTFIGYATDKANGVRTENTTLLETNLKYGIDENIDLHLVFSPYTETNSNGQKTLSHSDIELRSKINLWGNNGGDSAFALLPYVKLPAGKLSNDKVEGGLILTYGSEIDTFGFGAQLQIDRAFNDNNGAMDWQGSHTFVLGYDLRSNFAGYVEYIGELDFDKNYTPYVSLGFTQALSSNTQWDVGSKFGLIEKAQDMEVFTGITHRFSMD